MTFRYNRGLKMSHQKHKPRFAFFLLFAIMQICCASFYAQLSQKDFVQIEITAQQEENPIYQLEISVNDNSYTNYRRLQIQLPSGFSSIVKQTDEAINQSSAAVLRFLWTAPSKSDLNKIIVHLSVSERVEGNFRLPVMYQYLDKQRKSEELLGNIELQISKIKGAVKNEESIQFTFGLPDKGKQQVLVNEKILSKSSFTVQIMQSDETVNIDQLKKYFNINDQEIFETLQEGHYVYTVGEFYTEQQARSWMGAHSSLRLQGLVLRRDGNKLIKL